MKILIVDDSKAMRMIVTRTLRQAGHGDHTFVEAVDGADGLAKVASESPDLVLSDWNMPEVTGIEFLRALRASGEERFFHPHPFTDEGVAQITAYQGRDLYYALLDGPTMLGYGLLRGWDEGYEVPSLGIAIHPDARGLGLGQLLMRFLHAAARVRGAARVRLRVYPDNRRAVHLYESLGYEFSAPEGGYLVGVLHLR
jgi:CheY-like chemotaxis protein